MSWITMLRLRFVRPLSSSPVPALAWAGLAATAAVFGHGALLLWRQAAEVGEFGLPAQLTHALLLFAGCFAAAAAAGHQGTPRRWWMALAAIVLLSVFIRPLRLLLLLHFLVPTRTSKLETFPLAQPYQLVFAIVSTAVAALFGAPDLAEFAGAFLYVMLLTHPHHPAAHPSPVPVFGRLQSVLRAGWTRSVAAFRILPALARFAILVTALFVALHLLFRLFFWSIFSATALLPDGGTLATAWWVGLRFDLRVSIVTALPAVLLILLPRAGRGLAYGYTIAAGLFTMFAYVVDLGQYGWMDQRLSSRVLDELHHPAIGADVVWKSYPVIPAFAGLAFAALVFAWMMRRIAFAEREVPGTALPSWGRIACIPGFLLVGGLAMMGRVGSFPVRWSDASFTPNSFASSFALNPLHHFFDTMNAAPAGYDAAAVREHYPDVAAYLGVENPDAGRLVFARDVRPEPKVPGRPNIVIVFLESFAAFKVGIMGNPLDPTPEFDALARKSLLFTHFYVAAAPTARSVFSTITGIPDVNPHESATRNPAIVHQHTILNAIEGYDKHYFIGVSASWGNIGGLLRHNIKGLQLHESGFSEPYDLFFLERTHETLKGPKNRPFLAIIQTSGNHTPYTIPDDCRDFQFRHEDLGRLRRHGFEKVGEERLAFNSLRFLDYSLGHFMRLVSKEPWFDDTIFLLFGDHGTGARHGLPDAQAKLVRHHVPCILYAPKFFPEPRVIDRVASSLDILPTVADLLGVPHVNQTLGRSLFDERSPRYAYLDEGWHSGLLDDEFYLMRTEHESRLYRYRVDVTTDWSSADPERKARMERLCRGLHETSRYLLYHNRPPK